MTIFQYTRTCYSIADHGKTMPYRTWTCLYNISLQQLNELYKFSSLHQNNLWRRNFILHFRKTNQSSNSSFSFMIYRCTRSSPTALKEQVLRPNSFFMFKRKKKKKNKKKEKSSRPYTDWMVLPRHQVVLPPHKLAQAAWFMLQTTWFCIKKKFSKKKSTHINSCDRSVFRVL
jgi:hypothetical protein